MSIKIVRDTSKLNIDYTVDTNALVQSLNSSDEKEFGELIREDLENARKSNARSVAFPLISFMEMTSSVRQSSHLSVEEMIRIAADEAKAFYDRIKLFLVVPDKKSDSPTLGMDLDRYIGTNFVKLESNTEFKHESKPERKLGKRIISSMKKSGFSTEKSDSYAFHVSEKASEYSASKRREEESKQEELPDYSEDYDDAEYSYESAPAFSMSAPAYGMSTPSHGFTEDSESKLAERMRHMSDTFSEYLLYLIEDKNMENSDVYKRALVDRKTFFKIKNNADYHPQKLTALCLCVGAQLNLDETKDLLARAGYALSPCDKTDIIFSFFIENEIYDMIELDIQLEEHGLPCVIS